MSFQLRQRVVAGALAAAFAAAAFASHIPPSATTVAYSGTLQRDGSVTDAINSAGQDGYNFYCISATSGSAVSLVATSTNGLRPNLILLSTTASAGAAYSTIAPNTLSTTSNSSAASVTLNFTPTTTGTYTVVVSTWNDESGSYTIGGAGFDASPGACAGPVTPPPPPPPPVAANISVPATDMLTLSGMALVLAGVGAFVNRKSRRRK
jgi:hypothetical protein